MKIFSSHHAHSKASRRENQRGFTLVELLVTIAIIGALSALLITNLVGARARAKDVKKKGDLQQLKSALRLYYNDTQNYPSGSGSITLPTAGTVTAGQQFAVGTTVYMKQVPAEYSYYSDDTERFLLLTQLDNQSDSELQTNFNRCCTTNSHTGCPTTAGTRFVLCED